MTTSVLEGTLVTEGTEFDPLVLQSGRISELSPAYEPDVTRTVCETFESIMQGVVDRDFYMDLVRRKQEEDRQLIIQQVTRQLTRALPASPLTPLPATEDVVQQTEVISTQAWEPPDEDVTAFADTFPRVTDTITDLPIVTDEDKKTGELYRQAFWGKASGSDPVKRRRRSLRHVVRGLWERFVLLRNEGQ